MIFPRSEGIFCIYIISCMYIIYGFLFWDRLKADRSPKMVKLIGKGFLNLVANLFWQLPFASIKQAHPVQLKFS